MSKNKTSLGMVGVEVKSKDKGSVIFSPIPTAEGSVDEIGIFRVHNRTSFIAIPAEKEFIEGAKKALDKVYASIKGG